MSEWRVTPEEAIADRDWTSTTGKLIDIQVRELAFKIFYGGWDNVPTRDKNMFAKQRRAAGYMWDGKRWVQRSTSADR